ncbi:hypothetical protein [Metabacillus niabensis]
MKNVRLHPSLGQSNNTNQSVYSSTKRKRVKKSGCGCGKKKKQADE